MLCTDAAEGLPQEPPREADKIIPAGLARTHSQRMLKQWQHDLRYIASFENLVPLAESTIGLTYWARNLTTMPRSRSSRAVEETLFTITADRLDRLGEVDVLAAELEKSGQVYRDREIGFWGKDATNRIGWRYLSELSGVAALLVETAHSLLPISAARRPLAAEGCFLPGSCCDRLFPSKSLHPLNLLLRFLPHSCLRGGRWFQCGRDCG